MPRITVHQDAVWQWKLTELIFNILSELPEFTADDVYAEARKLRVPPGQIAKHVPNLFKSFQAAGYIKKTDRFVTSKRNDSSPLPIWASQTPPSNGTICGVLGK
jgi:hypothetical protein